MTLNMLRPCIDKMALQLTRPTYDVFNIEHFFFSANQLARKVNYRKEYCGFYPSEILTIKTKYNFDFIQ